MHIVPRRKNFITYERYIFNTRVQQTNETVYQYVTELKNMATQCDYGELREGLIRDRIVIGISDATLRARLMRETDLDLAKATQMCPADEMSKQQLNTLAWPTKFTLINEVRYGTVGKGQPSQIRFTKRSITQNRKNKQAAIVDMTSTNAEIAQPETSNATAAEGNVTLQKYA